MVKAKIYYTKTDLRHFTQAYEKGTFEFSWKFVYISETTYHSSSQVPLLSMNNVWTNTDQPLIIISV